MLEPAILIYTKAQVALVSNRVYGVIAPQGATKPYIVFNVVSQNYSHAMGGDDGLTETRVQFSTYGTTYASVKGVVEQLKAAYRNYIQGNSTIQMGNQQWVHTTLLANEIDLYEEDTGLYHTAVDIIFWHKEE